MRSLIRGWSGYLVAIAGVGTLTATFKLINAHINAATVALAFLLVILFVATWWGARPAVVGSLLSVLCFNFFFLPPFGTLTVEAPDNWIALIAFLVTAIMVGQLSADAKRRTEEAEAGQREIERLYQELRGAFERASHAEALRQSEKLKSALLDAVTHDIRTPLTSIKASVSTLLDKRPVSLDEESRQDMLEVIDEECDRLDRFVEGLIELARIEAGDMHLRRRWGAIDEILTDAIVRAEPLTRHHQVKIALANEIPFVQVDPRAVSEVVFALVDNAAKYSPVGSTILVTAVPVDAHFLEVAVESDGEGVPVALRERVFDKFFRATRNGDTFDARQPKGSGMGLAVAKGIVEAHGGRIWMEEGREGRATRVAFTLPHGDSPSMVSDTDSAEALHLNSNEVVRR
jgi:two-component system sensor histidine kinase KdpD